jgi:hypothetical protein
MRDVTAKVFRMKYVMREREPHEQPDSMREKVLRVENGSTGNGGDGYVGDIRQDLDAWAALCMHNTLHDGGELQAITHSGRVRSESPDQGSSR